MEEVIVITTGVKGKPYTDLEDKILLARVGHVPVKVIAEGLGRTLGGVHMRLTELRRQGRYQSSVKYKTPFRGHHIHPENESYNYFTPEEDKILCTAFGWFPPNDIAASIKRSPQSVQTRFRYLKKQGALGRQNPYGYQKFRPWTKKEVRYLTQNYGRLKTGEIAEKLNRAITAVERKSSALSIQFRKRNYTAGEVAQLLGVRWENVRRWVTEGLITGFDSGDKSRHYHRFTYAAVAEFIREWPGYYDPKKLRHNMLKNLAMKVKENGNEYLSINQAARLAEVPYHRISSHLRGGTLRGLLILGPVAQRNWRIRKGDLEKWVENNCKQSPLIKPTTITILLFGEEEEIWPRRCTRGMKCQQCAIEGRLQCKPIYIIGGD